MEKKTKKLSLKSIILSVLGYLIWVSASIIASQFVVVYLLYFILGRETLSTPLWTTVMNALVYLLALVLIIFVPARLFKIKGWIPSREELGLRNLPTWVDLLLAPIGLILSLLLSTFLIPFLSKIFAFDLSETQDVGYNFLNSGFDRVVAYFALCILAPIAEELIFRGFLYGKLRKKIPGKFSLFLSIFLVSLLFGILHGQWNVGITVFCMSLVLCGLREITGTIYSGIVLHILKNTVAFILIYVLNYSA